MISKDYPDMEFVVANGTAKAYDNTTFILWEKQWVFRE